MADTNFFNGFDFQLLETGEFKEDAVREELIHPILKKLGYKAYGHNRILYSKTLQHPFVKIGSQKRQINVIPDYLLEVAGNYAWVLDAKSPSENITSGSNIEQVYSYAIHPDIKVEYFALCNGKEFVVYSINSKEPILFFQLSEIDKHWEEIEKVLGPDRFAEKKIEKFTLKIKDKKPEINYSELKLPKPIKPRKFATRRHYGVHGYFTRQSWDILQHYIKHFTSPGETILDPFGGTGVTAIESIILGRKAINIDINPLTIFIVNALTIPVDFELLTSEFNKIKDTFDKKRPKSNVEIKEFLTKYKFPTNKILMKDANIKSVDKLFTKKVLSELAYLKHLILKVKDKKIQKVLLLVFSGLLTKVNLTYHNSKTGGGDAGIFRYYRYRRAPNPTVLDVSKFFEVRFKRIFAAKKELEPFLDEVSLSNFTNIKSTATDLSFLETESVDYIYTDPPYGKKIQYLDLSIMWTAWLDLEVTDEDRKIEVIEGGSLKKSKDEYSELLAKSIKEMYRVLKFNRWMSFVFAHKDPHYWHIIVETAEKCGFEYAGAVKQDNGQSSFKKRQNPFSVLTGQLIINFIKKETPKAIQKFNLGSDIYDLVIETIESVIAQNDGADLEQINDELIIKGLEFGFLDILSKEYKDLTPILMNEFEYNEKNQKFYIKTNQKFKTKIPLDQRIRYFLLSYLKRKEYEKEYPTTDDIILDIMPLLKNGLTPQNQTILNILESIADEIGNNRWRLKQEGQLKLELF